MTTNKSSLSSHHHYYQITSKFRSKSSDSLTNINAKNECQQKQKQVNNTNKMKKSQTVISGFETKPIQTTSVLRRRFSLFRLKRSQQSNENSNIQSLQQIIDQLRCDLQTKTDELEAMKEHIENKQPSNGSFEHALQFQTILNSRLEEMLTENDLLKKSIQQLESFAQQQKSKKENVRFYR